VLPARGHALLSDIVALFPVEQGAAEVLGYLTLDDEDIDVTMDEDEETLITYSVENERRRLRLPQVIVTRR